MTFAYTPGSKFWLDDQRLPPDSEWVWAGNYDEAVKILTGERFDHGSLDHDLFMYMGGTSGYFDYSYTYDWKDWQLEKTGLDVLKFIIENDLWPYKSLAIHTDLPEKRYEMAELILLHGPYEEYSWYSGLDGRGSHIGGFVFYASEIDSTEDSEEGSESSGPTSETPAAA